MPTGPLIWLLREWFTASFPPKSGKTTSTTSSTTSAWTRCSGWGYRSVSCSSWTSRSTSKWGDPAKAWADSGANRTCNADKDKSRLTTTSSWPFPTATLRPVTSEGQGLRPRKRTGRRKYFAKMNGLWPEFQSLLFGCSPVVTFGGLCPTFTRPFFGMAEWPIWLSYFSLVSHVVIVLNSSVNFLIYLFL